jgi:hypothetical protein
VIARRIREALQAEAAQAQMLDSDTGTPYVLWQPESDAARAFARVVERIMEGGSGDADETATLSSRATTGHDTGVDQ